MLKLNKYKNWKDTQFVLIVIFHIQNTKKDMKDIDLNVCLNYFKEADAYDIICAFSALVKNEWVRPDPLNSYKAISIKYDAAVQTLKIINKDWSVRSSDFMLTTYLPQDGYVLLGAIINLMKNDYHLEFVSKFGKFIPYIDEKQDIDYATASIHVKSEEPLAHEVNWTKVQNDFNDNNVEYDGGTVITISPVCEELAIDLRSHFSFTQDWKEIIDANGDYLLVNDEQTPNKIYVDGIAKEYTQDYDPSLLYSYDISSQFTKNVHGNHNNDWYIQRAICIILYNLSKEDKLRIYPTILNNDECLEWTYPEVQRVIVDFLNKQDPNKYVIYKENDNPASDVMELVKEAGKIAVAVDKETFASLRKRMQDVYSCMQQEVASRYNHPGLANDDLSPIEQHNLKLLKDFLVYFANRFAPLRQWLSDHEAIEVPFDVVEDYPYHQGTYSPKLEKAIIDRAVLCDTGTTFDCAFTIMWRMVGGEFERYEFDYIWWENSVNFLASKNNNHHDAAAMLANSDNNQKE